MREMGIYRGKRLDNGEWVEGFYSFVNWYDPKTKENVFVTHSILPVGAQDSFRVDPSTVREFTGLTDKNGKRIFEGQGIKYDASQGLIVNGVIKYGIIPFDFGNNGQHIGFYVEWQNDGANRWNDWWRHDLAFWLGEREVEFIGEPVPFNNEG